jgi:glycosyltransferase involved in cell wall biosynthesis
MRAPAVSVIIPYRDSDPYLNAAVASVERQTFKGWELLLVRGDRGAFAARLEGARRARAGVLALLDSDDLWSPDYLERHLAFWKRHARAGAALTYGPARYWFPRGDARDFTHAMPARGERVFEPGELLQNFLSSGYATVPRTSCSLLRRECLLALAPFAAAARRIPLFEDQFLMWGIAARWRVAAHRGAWVRYRQRSALEKRPRRYFEETLRDERLFLPLIRRYLARRLPGHPLLGPDGIAARIAALRRPGRRTPFGDYFFERVPVELRALARA